MVYIVRTDIMRFACEYYMFDVTYYYIYRHMDGRLYYVKYIADR